MSKLMIGLLVVLLLAAGCNEAAQEDVVAAEQSSTSSAPVKVADQATGSAELTLADGQRIEILSIGKFEEKQDSLTGRIAIAGRVAEAYPERGALVLVDAGNMDGCSDSCCPQAKVPVKLILEEFSGSLPEADQQVVIVGEISQQELGFDLRVDEIRSGDKVILERSA